MQQIPPREPALGLEDAEHEKQQRRPPTVKRRATSDKGGIVAAAYLVAASKTPESGGEEQRDLRRHRSPVLRFETQGRIVLCARIGIG